MNFEVHITPDFLRSMKALSKRYRSFKQDFKIFSESLEENPFQGVELSPGIRKIRMAIASKGRGKSGGARVITYTVLVSETTGDVYLIDLYDKADYSTVDLAIIKDIISDLEIGLNL